MTVMLLGSDKPCLLDEGDVFIPRDSSVQENLKDCLHLDGTCFYSRRVSVQDSLKDCLHLDGTCFHYEVQNPGWTHIRQTGPGPSGRPVCPVSSACIPPTHLNSLCNHLYTGLLAASIEIKAAFKKVC